ncbi:MAG: type I DNA topoisomerase [Planctomycetota bacterium]|jgi:DNA topoisomerase-1|nr:type I DNA topoisomerase [Planctomycetota bacterium]
MGGDNEINSLIDEFKALRVSPAALEESLGVKIPDLTAADASRLRRIIAFMRHDKLTLGRALIAAAKGSRLPNKITPRSGAAKPRKKPAGAASVPTGKAAAATAPAGRKSPTRRFTGKDNLLIVESPAKAKTIKKFLGGDFVVKASMGHVRDIPSRGRDRSDIGIDFQNRYRPYYVPIESREKVIKELRTAADKARHIYLAPDPDREGEAIAWHLKEVLDLPDDKVSRVTFNAITKSAVREAMERPSAVNMDLVNAQQGRRVLDRIVGYRLSPFLWKKVTKGLSAGRVQSVAVRLVAEREQQIQAFNPAEYWRIRAELATGEASDADAFTAELVGWKGRPYVLAAGDKNAGPAPTAPDAATAAAIAEALRGERYRVAEVGEREVKGRPAPPFITSSLQQAASTFLRLGAQRTMRIAQQLYEGVELEGGEAAGLITYMRTDSTRVAPEALREVREYIGENFAPPYLPEKPNFFSTRKGAQDAHEAIRPTSAHLTPDRVKPFLGSEQLRLYELIWRRFVASQLAPAEYRVTTAKIAAGDGVFEAKGRRVLFDGHTVLSFSAARKKRREEAKEEAGEEKDAAAEERQNQDEEQILPELKPEQPLDLRRLEPSRHFTQPPVRFTEASLVRELEKEGIGRPSTYAPIVQTIQERGYVRQENRRFHATRLGLAVTGILTDNFPDIMNVKFTARMESDLDRVEEGEVEWDKLVDSFYKPFETRLREALETSRPLKGAPAPNGEKCPLCGADMTIRYSQRGAFLGCSRYPECAGTRPLPGEDGDQDEGGESPGGEVCPECGAPMAKKRSRYGLFLACTAYPKCKGTRPIARNGQVVKLPETRRDCEKCGKPMVVKSGRRGPFLACSGYPECRNTKHIDKNGAVVELPAIKGASCEKCGAEMVVRMSRRGPFLACSAYPKCKNAKPLPKEEAVI